MVWPRNFLKTAYLLALLGATSAQAGNLFCCQDPATGRRTCGDGLPEQCRGRAYKVLDGAGNVIKEVGPPMTAEQKAQAQADIQRKKEQEAALREQRRKDQALLDTYSNLQEIDQARSRKENDIQETMKQTEAKITALQKQRKKLESELEFYKNKPAPPEIAKNLQGIDSDIKTQTGLLDSKKAELAMTQTKYDEEKRRYLELSSGRRQ